MYDRSLIVLATDHISESIEHIDLSYRVETTY